MDNLEKTKEEIAERLSRMYETAHYFIRHYETVRAMDMNWKTLLDEVEELLTFFGYKIIKED